MSGMEDVSSSHLYINGKLMITDFSFVHFK